MQKLRKNLDNILIVLFLVISLWAFFGPILQYKLIHLSPNYFGSGDSYAWFTHSQNIYDLGNFKYNAPFLNLNLEGFSSPEPPLFPQFTAFLAYALGVQVHDSQILLGSLLLILTILIFFITIKSYSAFLAYLSLPLCLFLFIRPFHTGLIFGFFPALYGFLFLFASLFTLLHMDIKYSQAILGIFISAMIMGHTVRVFEFIFFSGFFILFALLFKRINLKCIKKIAISGIFAFIISLYYLAIFKHRFFESRLQSQFSYTPLEGAKYLSITLSDFGFIKYIIIAGLILCFYFLIKERKNIKALVLIFPITAFLLIHFLRINRVYQLTFFWPVFLSLAFGVALFYVLQLNLFSKFNKSELAYFTISLIIVLILTCQYWGCNPLEYPRIAQKLKFSAINQDQWENLIWISENTEPDSEILFFYFSDTTYDFPYVFFPSKRLSFHIPLEELDLAIEQDSIKKDYEIEDNSEAFFYKRDSKFPLKITSIDKEKLLRDKTICDFDYIYGKVSVSDEKRLWKKSAARATHTFKVLKHLLKQEHFKLVIQNKEAYILKNQNKGIKCI